MVFATRLLPNGFVAGELRSASPHVDSRWVDVLPRALARLGVRAGDPVMVTCAHESVTGTVRQDGDKLAIFRDAKPMRDRVIVRRRG